MSTVMEMTQILYGDVLFFVNFTMDFLTLFITASILHRPIRRGRMTLAAAIGALYGVAACFMGGTVLFGIAVNVAVSLLMCYIAFGKRLLPCLALFYGSGCLLGGAMTALYSLVGSMSGMPSVAVGGHETAVASDIPLGWMAVVAGIVGAAAILGGRMEQRNRHARRVSLTVGWEERRAVLEGLIDSGNLLTDPLGGRPVIVVRREALRTLLPTALMPLLTAEDPSCLAELPPEAAIRVRVIPAQGIGGRTVFLALRPDRLAVDGMEKEALLALGNEGFDGADALVPGCLSEG